MRLRFLLFRLWLRDWAFVLAFVLVVMFLYALDAFHGIGIGAWTVPGP